MAIRVFTFNPMDAEEAARILAACTRLAGEGRKISVALLESSGTAPGDLEALGAGEPARVILGHSAMNRIREVSKEDYLAVVDGGVRFGDFADAVREAGLFFPHEADEATRDRTIAALVMAGARFPAEERFGRLREYILSLELVIPKGEIVRAGSRSVKDVTGYDLIGFVIGAGSRCGMIARATLRLLPAPFGGPPQRESGPGPCRSADVTRRFDDRAARPAAIQRLDERVFDVLDPAGIMKPFPPGVE